MTPRTFFCFVMILCLSLLGCADEKGENNTDGPSLPSDPTQPSVPTQPSDPTQPSQPSDPTQQPPEPAGTECTTLLCDAEFSTTYTACENGYLTQKLTCPTGTVCIYGSCTAPFSEDDPCEDAVGYGYCTADEMHAVVCGTKGRKTIWTCKDTCYVDSDGIVDCPKKPREDDTTPHECENDFKATCINNGAQVQLCQKHKIVTWDCYGNTCAVDSNNAIYCPKTAELAGLGGLESGGTYGDACNVKKYQEACIDQYYARICDYDGVVRIKPAATCKISASNSLKVEYSDAAPCDPNVDIMPFCINDGKAIGFCTYASEDLQTGVFKAAQCKSACNSQADAERCFIED